MKLLKIGSVELVKLSLLPYLLLCPINLAAFLYAAKKKKKKAFHDN